MNLKIVGLLTPILWLLALLPASLPQRSCSYVGHHEENRSRHSRAVESSLRRARLTQSRFSQGFEMIYILLILVFFYTSHIASTGTLVLRITNYQVIIILYKVSSTFSGKNWTVGQPKKSRTAQKKVGQPKKSRN